MMKITAKDLILYAVTDRAWAKEGTLPEQVEEAILGGVTMVQLREKNRMYENFYEEAEKIRQICRKYAIPFIVNDDVELAQSLQADGVHLGQEDGNLQEARKILGYDKIIGATAHNEAEARKAEQEGADYLGCGCMFPSGTKRNTVPLSVRELGRICSAVRIPVVAIGGVTRENADLLAESGISGVASVSGIFACADIRENANLFRSQIEAMLAGREKAATQKEIM